MWRPHCARSVGGGGGLPPLRASAAARPAARPGAAGLRARRTGRCGPRARRVGASCTVAGTTCLHQDPRPSIRPRNRADDGGSSGLHQRRRGLDESRGGGRADRGTVDRDRRRARRRRRSRAVRALEPRVGESSTGKGWTRRDGAGGLCELRRTGRARAWQSRGTVCALWSRGLALPNGGGRSQGQDASGCAPRESRADATGT